MAQDLRGKWALLTGAASGIGKETCIQLAQEGCNLFLVDINEIGLQSLADQLERIGSKVHYRVTDVTDKAQILALVNDVKDKIGSIDVLVNNAGMGLSAELRCTCEEDWEKLMNLNFFSVLKMTDAFLPQMLKRREGQIVNISTGQVFYPVPTWGAYAASKAALATYSECLTWELRRFGIKITTVFPGLINTPFYDGVKPRSFAQKFVLWWIRSLGGSPEGMARKIVKGIKKRKRRVIQSWINWVTYVGRRPIPHSYDLVGDVFAWALGEDWEG